MIPEEMEDEIEAEYDYDGGKKGGSEQDSVISLDRTTQWPNIEIKPDISLFETPHILIMTGSTVFLVHILINLGLVMLV